jgi:hypothetical protein
MCGQSKTVFGRSKSRVGMLSTALWSCHKCSCCIGAAGIWRRRVYYNMFVYSYCLHDPVSLLQMVMQREK